MDLFLHTQIRHRVSQLSSVYVSVSVSVSASFLLVSPSAMRRLRARQDFSLINRQIRGYWSSIIFLIPLFQVFQAQTPENVKGIIRFDLILKSLLVSQWLQIIQSWPQHKGIYFLLSIMIVSQVYFLFMYLTKDSYSCAKHNYVDKGLV